MVIGSTNVGPYHVLTVWRGSFFHTMINKDGQACDSRVYDSLLEATIGHKRSIQAVEKMLTDLSELQK